MKKALSLFSITALFFCVVSLQVHNGLAFDKRFRTEVTARTMGEIDKSKAILWVRNLSQSPAKVEIANTSSDQGSRYVSEPIVGGATMRIAEQLPESLRRGSDLVVQSDDEIAAIFADQDLPVDRSEFFQPGQREISELGFAPRWVSQLEIVGRSGSNLLKAEAIGYAPVVKGADETGKRYSLSVALSLGKRNSSVEVRLINRNDKVIKSAVLSSSVPLYWRSELGEFIGGNPDYPVRFEMKALTGRVQGFLFIRDVESGQDTPLPIVPTTKQTDVLQLAAGGPYGGGYAYFSNGVLDCAGSSYTYHVVDAPPNVCGTLKLYRNGSYEVTPGWICTDYLGRATKGSWTVTKDQTGEGIHIEWPDGSRTYGGEDKIDDYSSPYITSTSIDAVPPTSFSGSASDVMWGSGFGGATDVLGSFYEASTGKYWDGSGYNSFSQVFFPGSFYITGRWTANWQLNAVPPPSAHVPGHLYVWCASIDDQCNQRSSEGCGAFWS